MLMCAYVPIDHFLSEKVAALLDKEGHVVCEPNPASVQIHVLLGARTWPGAPAIKPVRHVQLVQIHMLHSALT